MILTKLKREWKTFSLAVISIAVGVWEGARDMGYDLTPLVPEKSRAYVIPGIGIAFLILRQWRDFNASAKDDDVSDK